MFYSSSATWIADEESASGIHRSLNANRGSIEARLNVVGRGVDPRSAIGSGEEFGGFVVANDFGSVFAAPANRRQLLNFIQCRRSGQRPVADIEEGHISTACYIMANLSMELGRSLKLN